MPSNATPVYDLRIDRVGSVEPFAEKVLTLLNRKPVKPHYRLAQNIYEDDGRGNIRDFVFAEYSAENSKIEVIFERSSLSVVNFRFQTDEIRCEQKPSIDGEVLRFVGETTSWYRVEAHREEAARVIGYIISDLELSGIEGYKTEEDRGRDESRLAYILAGNDPDLVLHRFNRIEHEHGFREALVYLGGAINALPEFAGPLSRTRAVLIKYRSRE